MPIITAGRNLTIPVLSVRPKSMLSEVRCELSNGHAPPATAAFPISLYVKPRVFLTQSRPDILHAARHEVLSFFDWPHYASRLHSISAQHNVDTRTYQRWFYCLALANPPAKLSDFSWSLDGASLVWDAQPVDVPSLDELLDVQVALQLLADFNRDSLQAIFSVFAPMISIAVLKSNLDLQGSLRCEIATITGRNSAELVKYNI